MRSISLMPSDDMAGGAGASRAATDYIRRKKALCG